MNKCRELIKDMLELQDKFNSKLDPDWRFKGWEWEAAIAAEAGELIESTNYKWWKAGEPDIDNIKVEAIDLLHFHMSILLNNFSINVCADKMDTEGLRFARLYGDEPYDMKKIRKWTIELIQMPKYPNSMFKIFTQLEMTLEDIYKAYIVKNCLNEFRQNNGYKDGSYKKMWNDVEDNVVAFGIAEKLECEVGMFETLYVELTKEYENV